MMNLWLILCSSMVLCWLDYKVTNRSYNNIAISDTASGLKLKQNLFSITLYIILILFAGLRIKYNDTGTYISGFNRLTSLQLHFSNPDNWKIGSNPGFDFLSYIIKYLSGGNAHVFIMTYSALTIILSLNFFRRYSTSFAFTVFLFITQGELVFAMAAIKQSFATAIGLWAVHAALQKKWFRFSLLLLLGISVHPYVIMFFIAPFFTNKPWTKRTYWIIFMTLIAIIGFSTIINNIVTITSAIGETYNFEMLTDKQGLNFFRVLVYLVPVVLSVIIGKKSYHDSSPAENLMINFSIICASIMVMGLFGTANLFGRLGLYFDPFVIIALPWMIKKLEPKKRAAISILCVLGYLGYFYYAYAISENFSSMHKAISIIDFFRSLF